MDPCPAPPAMSKVKTPSLPSGLLRCRATPPLLPLALLPALLSLSSSGWFSDFGDRRILLVCVGAGRCLCCGCVRFE